MHLSVLFLASIMWSCGEILCARFHITQSNVTRVPSSENVNKETLGDIYSNWYRERRRQTRENKSSISIERAHQWRLVSSFDRILPFKVVSSTSDANVPRLGVWTPKVHSRKGIPSEVDLEVRLHKLENYFSRLGINDADCRLRLLCQLAEDPAKYEPLSLAFLDEIRYNGEVKGLTAQLLTTNEGTQLLTYIEASYNGKTGLGCSIWEYRCPTSIDSMINYKALVVWKEMVKWLTIQMIAKHE